MAAPKWTYEKFDEEKQKIKYLPQNDLNGKITGKIVFGLKAWMDENPEERIRLGWTKHIHKTTKDIEYNKQTQYLIRSTRQVDDYTVEDVYFVLDKSEEQMRLEELTRHDNIWYTDDVETDSDILFWG